MCKNFKFLKLGLRAQILAKAVCSLLFVCQRPNMSLDVDIACVVSDTLSKLTVIWDEIGSSQEERRAHIDQ